MKTKVKTKIIVILTIIICLMIYNNKETKSSNMTFNGANITFNDMESYVRSTPSNPTFKGFYIYLKNRGY